MTAEIGRRRALQIAALGASLAAAGGVGTWRSLALPGSSRLDAVAGERLREPPVLNSRDGALEVDLTASLGVALGGRRTRALGYNGMTPGPTLRVAPGDKLRILLANDLDDTTNLHTHGLHVSPQGTSDNVFRTVKPGQRAQYEYSIPRDHPAGVFWYHPHHHGTVADHVFGGLFGALLVAGADQPASAQGRVLVISDTTLTGEGEVAQVSGQQVMAGREGELVLVNGQLLPRIDATPGSQQRWRVVNACTSRFLELQLDDHTWGFLGYDGHTGGEPQNRDTVLLAPGNRADLLVLPQQTGTFTLRTLGHDRGMMGMMGGGAGTSAETTLATVEVASPTTGTVASSMRPPVREAAQGEVPDLRRAMVDRRRTITFTMGMGMGGGSGMDFGFDGREFDPRRVDQQVRLGSVEEWTIGNTSPMEHPSHLHVWPMHFVDARDLDASGRPDWRDVVIVPAHGQVTVRVLFSDFVGRTVYHCHILDYEDRGMMGIVNTGS